MIVTVNAVILDLKLNMGQILAKFCPCFGDVFKREDDHDSDHEMQDHGQVITVEELEEQDYEKLKAK